MNFPQELHYTKEHEWIRVEGDIAYVGVTDFAQKELGDIVYVDITCTGSSFAADEVFGTVEAVKTVSDLFLPVSGLVLEVNPLLDANPDKVNNDPYGDGWMIKLQITNPEEVNSLLTADAYTKLIGV